MPLKVSVGLSKKKGLPEYGSLGASCHVEVELDSSLIQQDVEKFHAHVRRAYAACAQAVNDELSRQHDDSATHTPPGRPSSSQSEKSGLGNGSANAGPSNHHAASTKQRDYASRLASQIRGLGVRRLESLTCKLFNKSLAELTSQDASRLIDTLKDIKEGTLSVEAVGVHN